MLDKRPTAQELCASLKRSWPALFLPVVIIGMIRIGVISPSEAGAIAVAYSFVLGIVWDRFDTFRHGDDI